MNRYIHRVRQLSAKVVRRARRVLANLSQPSEIEKLLAALPKQAAGARIEGVRILITGSTRGVGRAMAETLAREGAHVIVHGRDGAIARKVAREITAAVTGSTLSSVAGDLSDPETDIVSAAIKAAGGIDVLINNAAMVGPADKHIWEIDAASLASVMQTNFASVHRVSAALVRHWLRAGQTGRIVFISTGAAENPAPKLGTYGVSKAAMESLVKNYATDLGASGICVTTVRLGSVKTDMTRSFFNWEDAEQLPPPETVMPVIRHVLSADPASVHGRVFTSWGMNADPVSGATMIHPAAAAPVFRYPQFKLGGRPVTRDSGKVLIFDRAENQFGPAPQVAEALTEMIRSRPLAIYPDDDYNQLCGALSETFSLSPDHFTIGAGSWDVLDRILKLYTRPFDSVVVNNPGWFGFTMLTQKRQLRQIAVDFNPGGAGNRPHHNLDQVLRSIQHDTRLIYLINPSNPEGVSLDRQEFLSFLSAVPRHIPVIVDEAYAEYATSEGRLIGPEIIEQTDHPVIVTRTFSKFYALAALRIGYGVARPEIIERLNRVSLIFSISKVAEVAAIAALGAHERNADLIARTIEERDKIFKAIQDTGRQPIQSDSCFMLVPPPTDLEKYYDTYAAQNIHMPRAAFFDGEFVMFPIARPDQNDRNLDIYRGMA